MIDLHKFCKWYNKKEIAIIKKERMRRVIASIDQSIILNGNISTYSINVIVRDTYVLYLEGCYQSSSSTYNEFSTLQLTHIVKFLMKDLLLKYPNAL